MMSISRDKQSKVIEAFSSTSRYVDDLLNIDKYFDSLISQMYTSELQINKANSSETEVPFLDLHLSILVGFISCKIYDKCDDFDFEIVNFPYLDGDFLVKHPPVFISCNLFGSPGCLFMFLTSRLEINC